VPNDANLGPAGPPLLAAIARDALGATLLELLAIPSVTGSAAESSASTCSPGGSTGWPRRRPVVDGPA